MNRRQLLIAFCLLAQPAPAAFGWNKVGHQIVARIAEQRLKNPRAKAAIAALLASDVAPPPDLPICDAPPPTHPPAPFKVPKSIVDVAVFADDIRDEPRGDGSGDFHFTNIEVDEPAANFDVNRYCTVELDQRLKLDPAKNCYVKLKAKEAIKTPSRSNCSVLQVAADFRILANERGDPAKRLWALKFLVHLVGDMHQPLHSAEWGNDFGGNRRPVRLFDEKDPKYGPLSLHAVWDANILERGMNGRFKPEDIVAFADSLNNEIGAEAPSDWLVGGETDWTMEAHQVAVEVGYKGFTKAAPDLPFKPTPAQVDAVRVTLDEAYYQQAQELIHIQLKKAGVRLAALLDQAFD